MTAPENKMKIQRTAKVICLSLLTLLVGGADMVEGAAEMVEAGLEKPWTAPPTIKA